MCHWREAAAHTEPMFTIHPTCLVKNHQVLNLACGSPILKHTLRHSVCLYTLLVMIVNMAMHQ